MSPVGRPIASSRAAGNGSIGVASHQIAAAKDSLPAHSSRTSSRRLEQIERELTDYDRAVLVFLAEVRLSTGHQIARRLWSSSAPTDANARAARRSLARLEGSRVIDRLARRVGGVRGGSASIVYGLGPSGRRLLARTGYQPKRLGTPGDRYVAHTLSVGELVVRLHEAALRGELDLIEVQTEPQCWRGFLAGLGARLILKPDLFARVGSGAFEDRWFIEVDRATEASGTLVSKAQRYLAHYRSGAEQGRHGVYPRVVWTVPDRRRADQVRAALGRLPAEARRLFVVWLYAETVGRLIAEAGS